MRIRLLKPYGFSRPGDVLEPDDPVAQLLIERGIAEVDAPREEKAVMRVVAKRRKRRRSR
jgi:hypothetical protein